MKNKSNGFTLVETLVVVVIITIIAAISIPALRRSIAKSNQSSAISRLKIIFKAQIERRATKGAVTDNLGLLMQEGIIHDDSGCVADSPTCEKHGYLMQATLDGDSVVISVIPQSASGVVPSGFFRYGIDGNGVLYEDSNNLTTHYATFADLTSGTSRIYSD